MLTSFLAFFLSSFVLISEAPLLTPGGNDGSVIPLPFTLPPAVVAPVNWVLSSPEAAPLGDVSTPADPPPPRIP